MTFQQSRRLRAGLLTFVAAGAGALFVEHLFKPRLKRKLKV